MAAQGQWEFSALYVPKVTTICDRACRNSDSRSLYSRQISERDSQFRALLPLQSRRVLRDPASRVTVGTTPLCGITRC